MKVLSLTYVLSRPTYSLALLDKWHKVGLIRYVYRSGAIHVVFPDASRLQ